MWHPNVTPITPIYRNIMDPPTAHTHKRRYQGSRTIIYRTNTPRTDTPETTIPRTTTHGQLPPQQLPPGTNTPWEQPPDNPPPPRINTSEDKYSRKITFQTDPLTHTQKEVPRFYDNNSPDNYPSDRYQETTIPWITTTEDKYPRGQIPPDNNPRTDTLEDKYPRGQIPPDNYHVHQVGFGTSCIPS